jgi:4-hydroxybutyrate dehydrogenase
MKMMKTFKVAPAVSEYDSFREFAVKEGLGEDDLILTNEYIYNPVIEKSGLTFQALFQEKYGAGEPTDVMIDAILSDLRSTAYHRIIAVGGGTIIDIAKVLAVAECGDTVDDLFNRMGSLKKVHPLYIIPTTCGTGSEVTNLSIINRTTKGTKQGLVSQAMFAEEAVLISEMLKSLPYCVFATSSIDAMIHSVESYLSPNAGSYSELFSMAALRLILPGWRAAAESDDPEAWKQDAMKFLRASDFAGIAFGNAGCAAVHALSYPLGGTHHIPHGKANQMMFADVMRKYKEKKPIGKITSLEEFLAELLEVDSD